MIACAFVGIGAQGEEGNIPVVRRLARSGMASAARAHRVANVEDATAEDVSRDGALASVAVGGDWALLEAVMRDEDTGPRDGVYWSLPGAASFRWALWR